MLIVMGCLAFTISCDDRQVRINADQFHDGKLKGYTIVYVQDYENGVAYREESDDVMGFSVFEKEDGSYTIEYQGDEFSLKKLDEPERLLGTDYINLHYSFGDGKHFVQDIPTSY